MAKYVTITHFGLQTNSNNLLYATWKWGSDSETDHFQIRWKYGTGDGIEFLGSESSVGPWDIHQTTYTIPDNAERVKLYIRPIAKTHKVKDKEVVYWTADWCPVQTYEVSNLPPTVPPVPTVTIDGSKLSATVTVDQALDRMATEIEFQVTRDDGESNNDYYLVNTTKCRINAYIAKMQCTAASGYNYRARCRAVRGTVYSNWSEYSSNVGTSPVASSGIISCRTDTSTSIFLQWGASSTATGYDIEYTTEKKYFDGSNQITSISVGNVTQYYLTGLETGKEYFFRVRAKNSNGESDWSGIKSCVLGEKPSAPTSWSNTTTAIQGETVKLYWMHNSKDGSKPTHYNLEVKVNGTLLSGYGVNTADNRSDSEKDEAFEYTLALTNRTAGSVITWRVKTAGITNEYSDWSAERTITIYSQPTLSLRVTNASNVVQSTISSFPFYIRGEASPTNQTHNPIGYYVSIVSNNTYETTDNLGKAKIVRAGDTVYSKNFDANVRAGWVRSADGGYIQGSVTNVSDTLLIYMSANNIDLENNMSYTVKCTVSMNSGLTATATTTFTVSWSETTYEVNAEIGIDEQSAVAYICPYCKEYAAMWSTTIPTLDTTTKYLWNYKEIIDSTNGSVLFKSTPELIYTYDGTATIASAVDHYARSNWAVYNADLETGTWPTRLPNILNSGSKYLWHYVELYDSNDTLISTTNKTRVCSYTDVSNSNWAVINYYFATAQSSNAPLVEDRNVNGTTMSVYRREFDGKFTPIQTNISNNNTYVVDPHPALDYARYRVVATDIATGAISYYDVPAYPVGEDAVIIQWDEEWSEFDSGNPDVSTEQPWAGSLLRLPYNVDVSDGTNLDVEMIEYIGREHPVSYYGTQVGETCSINADIESDDESTIYALRRLQKWMGDVYFREPSGIGYWANVSVSMSQKHCELTIPVSISITRVEGGT